MGKIMDSKMKQWCKIVICFVIASGLLLFADCSPQNRTRRLVSAPPVTLRVMEQYVVLENGILKLTLSNPDGLMTGIEYNGIDNILEYRNKESRRGYWDIVWIRPGHGPSHFDMLEGTRFNIIAQDENRVEVSFTKTWNPSTDVNGLPLNVDKRFIMLRGRSGFYTYAIYEHLEGWPALNIDEARIAFKLQQNLFRYMAVSDDIQRVMPSGNEFDKGRALDYKEARLLENPENPALRGQVEDKYQYSCENKDSRVHGWIGSNPHTGFWVITPSDEFRAGGPIKPDLTSHAGPTSLASFFSAHYAGPEMGVKLQEGEAWKKVFGPVFVYLNSDLNHEPRTLWEDAKQQMQMETRSWPYGFPLSEDFVKADQRGTVRGRLMVRDRYLSRQPMPARNGYIGLAPPGDVGSWQMDTKGYQFWNQTDAQGYFIINGVRPGSYSLNAFVYGVLGDFQYNVGIEIKPGTQVSLGDVIYDPPRHGPTLWEIGVPDRTAAEFYVPDPAPGLINRLYVNHTDKFRQYGLWDRYTDLYPHGDIVYTIGESNYHKDWFFAHVNRRVGNKRYLPTTWQIIFDLPNVIRTGTYKLQIALASATYGQLQIWLNDPNRPRPHLETRHIGRDNAVARHGIHGLYHFYSFDVSGSLLVSGRNTIFLKQANAANPFTTVMYDYLRLEGPPSPT